MGHGFIEKVTDIEGRIEKTNKTIPAWQAEDTANTTNTLNKEHAWCVGRLTRLATGGDKRERSRKWSQSGNGCLM